ncbi:MAG: hypothetical protein ACYDAN_02540 [Candidatus Limnocylindrales bacterium]
MAFLRRILGSGRPSAPSGATGFVVNATWFTRLRPDAALEIVGEAYRQELVLKCRPPRPGDLPEGVPMPAPGFFKALVMPEPTNEYDRNAITVVLWAGDTWTQCGYLSREDAVRYGPVFAYVAHRRAANGEPAGSEAIACDAAQVPERGGVGVVLHLGTPGELVAELATDDRTPAAHAWQGKLVVFTGEAVNSIAGVPLDRHAQHLLAAWAGCLPAPRVTKKTEVVVVAYPGQMTAGEAKAIDYGLPRVPEPEFLSAIGIPADLLGGSQPWASGTTPVWARR